MKPKIDLVLVVLAFLCVPLSAQEAQKEEGAKPVQLSLWAPVQIFDSETSIRGVRLGLFYSNNRNVSGLDACLVARVKGDMHGAEFGLVNLVDGGFRGLQRGLVNCVGKDFSGWQDGLVNRTKGVFRGFQSGFYNSAAEMRGFQLGIWNTTGKLEGLQVGLLNFNKSGEPHGFLPIVNYAF